MAVSPPNKSQTALKNDVFTGPGRLLSASVKIAISFDSG
jgi:hypothetical protein